MRVTYSARHLNFAVMADRVIVHIMGGLGNQLFQYAAGRALSERLSTELYISKSPFLLGTPSDQTKEELRVLGPKRHYELTNFGIDLPLYHSLPGLLKQLPKPAPPHMSLRNRLNRKATYALYHLQKHLLPLYLKAFNMSYFKEPHFHYTPRWSSLKGSVYLEGYWQSPRYFKEIEHKLRKSLTLSRFESEKTKSLLKEIAHPLSTALHFRRGDYHSIGCVLPLSYYRRAIDLLRKLLQGETPQIYIFSDDVEELKPLVPEVWCNEPPPYTIVSEHNLSPYEELLLMSRCQHRITANSSYAWWGAWLSEPPSKLPSHTIAPKQWFPTDQGLAAARNTRDLYPDEWILL